MRLMIDCDPGNGVPGANVDDGLAIALALGSEGLPFGIDRVEAITTVAGNTPARVGAGVALELLRAAGREIPVHVGAECAVVEPDGPWREHLDRRGDPAVLRRLWGEDAGPAPVPRSAVHAALALAEAVRRAPGEVAVVAIGPLTNLALAMRLSPGFARDVAGIAVMGGVFDVDGYQADTNFGVDPEAARIVLRSGAPVTLLPLDVTTTTLFTQADLDRVERIGTPLADHLVRTTRPWIDYSMQVRRLPGMWVHDALAVAALTDPGLLSTREYALDVELAPGPSRGSTLRWPAGPVPGQPMPAGPDWPPARVATAVDNAALIELIVERVARAG
jgi:inosine-uridine nucleoside N-ribohydrolase